MSGRMQRETHPVYTEGFSPFFCGYLNGSESVLHNGNAVFVCDILLMPPAAVIGMGMRYDSLLHGLPRV